MKLLHINLTDSSGSTGSIIKNINNYIHVNRPDIETYTASQLGVTTDFSLKYMNNLEFFFLRATRKLFGKSLFGTYIPTKRLIKYIKKVSPDIIHIHVIHHQSLNYKMLFKFLTTFKGKVFFTLHDCWAFTGGCYHYSEAGCDNFLRTCKLCDQNAKNLDCRKPVITREFEFKKSAFSKINNITFVAVSDWLAGEAKKSFLKDKEIVTIHNGINTDVFKLLDIPKNNQFTVISVASYWTERKHLDILLGLADELKDINFVVVGEVGTVDKNQHTNVDFIGKTSSTEELCRLYNSSHVFANFSTEETFGLVTAEAMACGLPVIAFNKTACGEIVSPECGYTVETVDEYKKALIKLKGADFSKYRYLCRKQIEYNYTTGIMCKKYTDLYISKVTDGKQ